MRIDKCFATNVALFAEAREELQEMIKMLIRETEETQLCGVYLPHPT